MARAFVEGLGWVEKQTAVVEINEPGTYSITPDRGKVFDAVKVSVNISLDDYVKKTDFDELVARVEALEKKLRAKITFEVESFGVYEALEEMTWEEWCGSAHNTDGWFVNDDGNVTNGVSYIKLNGVKVNSSNTIINGGRYTPW